MLIPSDHESMKGLLLRNIFEGFSMGMNFTSIQMVPLSTYEILLNSKGIMGTVISHFWLKERINLTEKFLIFFAFIGMILVVKPILIISLFNPNSDFELYDSKKYGKINLLT